VTNLETQGKQSSEKLRVIQEGLLAKAQQSADELSALNRGIEASASMTRELSDKQQNLAEAKEQVGEFRITMSIAPDGTAHSGVPGGGATANEPSIPAEADFQRSFFHGRPEVSTQVSVFFQEGILSVDETGCQSSTTPCLKGSGGISKRYKTTGEVVPPATFDASLNPLIPDQPASSLDISMSLDAGITHGFPLLARDMEVNGFDVFNCLAQGSAKAQLDRNGQESSLRRYEDTLPMRVRLKVMEELRGNSDGRNDFAFHHYEYLRVHDPTRHLDNRGCLQTVYGVSY
jgi:hypothetical protein